MAHIHKLIDFVVSVYIVYDNKVLFIKHKEMNTWLPIGGHVELNEDPEQALTREIKEECGLKVKILGNRPKIISKTLIRSLIPPTYLNIHRINKNHKHIGLEYIAVARSSVVRLNKQEHEAYKWFSLKDLDNRKFSLRGGVKFYAKEAIKKVTNF
jgi:8-oxo-dGTP diphosphatase